MPYACTPLLGFQENPLDGPTVRSIFICASFLGWVLRFAFDLRTLPSNQLTLLLYYNASHLRPSLFMFSRPSSVDLRITSMAYCLRVRWRSEKRENNSEQAHPHNDTFNRDDDLRWTDFVGFFKIRSCRFCRHIIPLDALRQKKIVAKRSECAKWSFLYNRRTSVFLSLLLDLIHTFKFSSWLCKTEKRLRKWYPPSLRCERQLYISRNLRRCLRQLTIWSFRKIQFLPLFSQTARVVHRSMVFASSFGVVAFVRETKDC